ncbi:MAG TPA: DUF1579 domain-containing protein [Flavisolibacter sp.]
MKRKTFLFSCVLAFVMNANAQQPDSTAMANWVKYMTPGKEHQMIASWDGTWEGEITMWMTPGAPPSKSKGVATNKMVLDGRYQQATYTGSFEGMPFNGMSTLAFDNAKKTFISTWIDNMGTGIMIGEGPWDEKSRSITLKGKMIDPTTGKECDFREVFTIVDDDHQLLEMYGPDPATGKEFKTMEIRYTRKK